MITLGGVERAALWLGRASRHRALFHQQDSLLGRMYAEFDRQMQRLHACGMDPQVLAHAAATGASMSMADLVADIGAASNDHPC
jgi:hypothetical protein